MDIAVNGAQHDPVEAFGDAECEPIGEDAPQLIPSPHIQPPGLCARVCVAIVGR